MLETLHYGSSGKAGLTTMKSSVRPMINAFRSQRAFAAQAKVAVRESTNLPKQAPQISRLPSGTVVASLENYSPVSKVAIVFNAGSKFENVDNVGVTHCLRNSANLSTGKKSGFSITRSMDQLGGSLSCLTSRDQVFYQMEILRNRLEDGFGNLALMSTNNMFESWSMKDNLGRTKLDLGILEQTPQALMVEELHKVAYRFGLGKSLYMEPHLVGSHGPDMLAAFVNEHYTVGNMAVVGLGVDHDTLVKLVQTVGAHSGPIPVAPVSLYHGGEARISTSSSLVHAAVVTEAAGLGSSGLLALGVLQYIMGVGPSIKYSSHLSTSMCSKAAASVASGPFAASCINMNYADSGLFGFHAIALKEEIGTILKALMTKFNSVSKGGVNEEDLKRGKAQLRASIHMSAESQCAVLGDIAAQVLLSGQVLQPSDVDSAINKITLSEVQAIARKVINGKPSMAAVGNLGATPYLDELMA